MKFILMLWKKSLNSDSQQFLQYQQNEQSPLTITHWIQKRPQHMMLEIQFLAWERHKNVAGYGMVRHYHPIYVGR
jgi:hypothetical protein